MFLQQGNCLIHVTAADGKADILGFIPSDGLQDDVNIDILLPQQGEDLVGDSGLIFHPHQRQTGYVLVFATPLIWVFSICFATSLTFVPGFFSKLDSTSKFT